MKLCREEGRPIVNMDVFYLPTTHVSGKTWTWADNSHKCLPKLVSKGEGFVTIPVGEEKGEKIPSNVKSYVA